MKSIKSLLPSRSSPSSAKSPPNSSKLSMSQSTLPGELIESIIDELGAANAVTALKQCSLVSQAFVYPSQKFLFRSIDLDRRLPRKKYYQRFHRLVGSRPHIGAHVRELRLGDGGEEDFGGGGSDESWITSTKTLPHTLTLLPRLEFFSLSFNSDLTSWRSLPADLRNAIAQLFRLPSLSSVALEFITAFPPQLLMSLAQIRTLSLSCVEVDPYAPVPTDVADLQTRWAMRLENLFLRGTSPATIGVMAKALKAAPAPMLKRLAVTPTFENGFSDAASELMTHSGEELHTFEWLPSIHFSASSGAINLALLPHLQALRFSVSFRKSHAHGPFPEILRLLSQLAATPARNSVKKIVMDCHCVRVQDKIGALWRPLDKVLAMDAFDGLKELRIRMCVNTTSSVERHLFGEAFEDLLPLLKSKGETQVVLETLEDIPVWCETA